MAALFPWELGEKADPFGAAPEGIKPEWYFLFMFQTLKELPPHIMGMEGEMLGVLFFGMCGLVLVAVPFLDRGRRSRQVLNVLAVLSVMFILGMTYRALKPSPESAPIDAVGDVHPRDDQPGEE